MSELAFLLELLLNHDELSKEVRQVLKDRIVWVEQNSKPIALQNTPRMQPIALQSATEVAQTLAASEALINRQKAIAASVNNVDEKGRTSPRKF